MALFNLLTAQHANKKLSKSGPQYHSVGLHLAPACSSGYNVCKGASAGCIKGCLNTAGHGRYGRVQEARIKRTVLLFTDLPRFKSLLMEDLRRLVVYCEKRGLTPTCRLNLTSDIAWEVVMPELFTAFPQVRFYDYTKIADRLERKLPTNYHLTFSKSESNARAMLRVLNTAANIAVVFANSLPKRYLGRKVVNGDEHDLRFLDGKNKIIGLLPKGRAKYDRSGFVVMV